MILGINGIIAGKGAIPMDVDAQAFITAASITDSTQQSAINQLVLDLKSANIWTKMKAIYPFVGGTASQHRFNLKDPRPVAGAFYLDFYGGGTHSANGYQPDGATAYANTNFKPRIDLGVDTNVHMAKYNRTNDLSGNKIDGVYGDMGGIYFLQQNYSAGNGIAGDINSIVSYTPTDTRGLFTTTRTSSTSVKVFKNTTQQGSTNTSFNTLIPGDNVYIGARNEAGIWIGFYNTYEVAFFSLGNGLSDSEVTALYNAVNAYQVALSRNI